jgi:hypothetical protein
MYYTYQRNKSPLKKTTGMPQLKICNDYCFGYMKALNVILDLHYCRVNNSSVSKLLNWAKETRSYATF